MVVLQNSLGFVDSGRGSCSETCVTYDGDGTEEVSINVEEAVDIKNEMPEAIKFPPIKTENEVRLWGVCEVMAAHILSHLLSQKGNCEIWLPYDIENWIGILKRRDILEVIAINVMILFKYILKKKF